MVVTYIEFHKNGERDIVRDKGNTNQEPPLLNQGHREHFIFLLYTIVHLINGYTATLYRNKETMR